MKDCKIYAESNFDLSKLNIEDQIKSYGCISSFSSIRDFSISICSEFISTPEDQRDSTLYYFKNFYGVSYSNPPSIDAMIQSFVNYAVKHPEKWNMVTTAGISEWLSEKWPCENVE